MIGMQNFQNFFYGEVISYLDFLNVRQYLETKYFIYIGNVFITSYL